MRHKGVLAAFALVIVAAVLLFAAIANGFGRGRGAINVTATLVHIASREVGRPGTQSNASEQAWRITDRYGHHIGRMLMQCRWIVPRARLCTAEIQMPLGKITVTGSSATPFEGEFAVTGGTGRYRSGGGVMRFQATGFKKEVLFIRIKT